MELKEFVKGTLVEISAGVRSANSELATQGFKDTTYKIEKSSRESARGYITFDVAVTVSEARGKKAGGSILVYVAQIGGRASQRSSTEQASRIKFHVFPVQDIK